MVHTDQKRTNSFVLPEINGKKLIYAKLRLLSVGGVNNVIRAMQMTGICISHQSRELKI